MAHHAPRASASSLPALDGSPPQKRCRTQDGTTQRCRARHRRRDARRLGALVGPVRRALLDRRRRALLDRAQPRAVGGERRPVDVPPRRCDGGGLRNGAREGGPAAVVGRRLRGVGDARRLRRRRDAPTDGGRRRGRGRRGVVHVRRRLRRPRPLGDSAQHDLLPGGRARQPPLVLPARARHRFGRCERVRRGRLRCEATTAFARGVAAPRPRPPPRRA